MQYEWQGWTQRGGWKDDDSEANTSNECDNTHNQNHTLLRESTGVEGRVFVATLEPGLPEAPHETLLGVGGMIHRHLAPGPMRHSDKVTSTAHFAPKSTFHEVRNGACNDEGRELDAIGDSCPLVSCGILTRAQALRRGNNRTTIARREDGGICSWFGGACFCGVGNDPPNWASATNARPQPNAPPKAKLRMGHAERGTVATNCAKDADPYRRKFARRRPRKRSGAARPQV